MAHKTPKKPSMAERRFDVEVRDRAMALAMKMYPHWEQPWVMSKAREIETYLREGWDGGSPLKPWPHEASKGSRASRSHG